MNESFPQTRLYHGGVKMSRPAFVQEAPRKSHGRPLMAPERRPQPPKKPNRTVLVFLIGAVVGLIFGLMAAMTITSSVRAFEQNPHGAVQVMREVER